MEKIPKAVTDFSDAKTLKDLEKQIKRLKEQGKLNDLTRIKANRRRYMLELEKESRAKKRKQKRAERRERRQEKFVRKSQEQFRYEKKFNKLRQSVRKWTTQLNDIIEQHGGSHSEGGAPHNKRQRLQADDPGEWYLYNNIYMLEFKYNVLNSIMYAHHTNIFVCVSVFF